MIKDLGATPFQIVLLTMVKPVASIFSFYWSERISRKRESLKMNLLGAGLLGRVPFIAALFFDNIWFLIAASALYMLFLRASIPAWMEIIKVNLPGKGIREQFFSVSSALGYGEGVLIAIGIGSLLDHHLGAWKLFYLGALALGILGIIFQVALPVREVKESIEKPEKKETFKERFIRPWIDCIELMRERSDFRRFQWAFMVGGLGLMIIQPVIPIFFAETLKLSYRDLLIAYSICKGLGFVLTSRLWGKALNQISVSLFTSFVLVGFGVFPLLIIFATYSSIWLYMAYFVYGIAQAGSHLIWHLSGPIFAGKEHSSRYSGTNIVLVGIRGTLGPPLGGLLAICLGPISVLFISAILCIGGTSAMLFKAPAKLKEIP
jgi:MFS family permease